MVNEVLFIEYMSKIDWSKALADYLCDETKSYSSVASKYGVSLQAVKKRAIREKWQDLRQKSLLKVNQELPELVGETIAQINARHVHIARLLQSIAVRAIRNGMMPKDFPQAVGSLKIGVEIERKAAGLDKEINHTQVNVLAVMENDRQKYGF